MRRQLARINWIKLQWLKIRIRMINKCLNLNEFGWYIPGLAVINAHVGHTRYYFSNISWNWLCYQRAFSAIYQNYFWKLSIFAGTILLQIWLYTHMPSLVAVVKKKMKYYALFRVLRWEFAIYILQSIYVHLLTFLINLSEKCIILV